MMDAILMACGDHGRVMELAGRNWGAACELGECEARRACWRELAPRRHMHYLRFKGYKQPTRAVYLVGLFCNLLKTEASCSDRACKRWICIQNKLKMVMSIRLGYSTVLVPQLSKTLGHVTYLSSMRVVRVEEAIS